MIKRGDINNTFLALLRLGIGHEADVPSDVDWKTVYELASAQGLSAIVFDGIQTLSTRGEFSGEMAMDIELKQRWIGLVLKSYERRYMWYRSRIASLAEFYNSHGYKLMVLKGYGLSLNYPVSEHRPCGDIDIWAFEQHKEADEALNRELGLKIDNSYHHHTVFDWKGCMVENHYDIVNVHVLSSSVELERIFKELAMNDSCFVDVEGQRVYLPVPDFHALFIVRHSLSHFAAVEISLRHVLDWAFYVEKHTNEINWAWFWEVCERFHMGDFVRILNAICVEDLGFDTSLFRCPVRADNSIKGLKDRVLADIISPEFQEEQPSGLIPRVIFKYSRWQANAWKHRLCYSEGRFRTFWKSLWAHLLKPTSI